MIRKVDSPFKILNKKEKKNYLILLVLIFFSSMLEIAGIGAIVPLSIFLVEGKMGYFDPIVEDKNNLIYFFLLGLFIFFFIKFIFLIIVEKIKYNFIFNQQTTIASKLYNNYLSENLEFHKKKKISKILQTISSDAPIVAGQFMQSYLILINEVILIIGLFLFLTFFNYKITLFAIFFGSILLIYFKFFLKKKINKLSIIKRLNQKNVLDLLYSSLNSISEIKIFNLENHFYNKFLNYQSLADKALNKNIFYESITRPALEFFSFIFLIFAIIYLTKFDNFHNVIPTLSLFVAALFKILPSTNRILTAYYKLTFSTVSVDALSKEIGKNIERKIFKKNILFKRSIKLENINFDYIDDKFKNKNILKDITIEIKKGFITGIHGPSGVGKTTLLNIVLGLYKAQSGKIYCDDSIINTQNSEWSKLFSYVPQKVFLFPGTIRDNIIFNEKEENFDENRYRLSIEISDLSDFINSRALG